MKFKPFAFFLFFLFIIPVQAQEEETEEEKEIKHSVAFSLGVTHVPRTLEEGVTVNSQYLPTLGFDYYRHLNERWKLGVVLDLELGKYEVEFEGETLKRETAFVTGLVTGFNILKGWNVYAGPGIEFERNKNLFIIRTSMEYEFEIGENLSLAPILSYDFKKEYGSYSFSVIFAVAF